MDGSPMKPAAAVEALYRLNTGVIGTGDSRHERPHKPLLLLAVLASLPALTTKMVLCDTAVVGMTAELEDPIDRLFGAQLGGGTDIHMALTYCTGLVQRPTDTTLVLITDLYEGGDATAMLRRAAGLVAAGVNLICLLALTDTGSPSYDHHHAAKLAAMGVPVFACTPDKFADLMAAALSRHDLHLWAEQRRLKLERSEQPR